MIFLALAVSPRPAATAAPRASSKSSKLRSLDGVCSPEALVSGLGLTGSTGAGGAVGVGVEVSGLGVGVGAGFTGATGATGFTGTKGSEGSTGLTGATGPGVGADAPSPDDELTGAEVVKEVIASVPFPTAFLAITLTL